MPPPEHVYRTEGVVLRRSDLGETDRILTLYTQHYGKIRIAAKGVRKPTSHKAGHVELFTRVDVLVARGRTLDVLTQAQMLDAFLPLRGGLVETTYAAHIVELLDAFTEEGDTSPALYTLLVNGLSWLCQTNNLARTARYYELRLLELAGYRPELVYCVVCGRRVEAEDQFYSAREGGVICPACGQARTHAHPISLNALKVLRYLQTRPFEVVEQLGISIPVQVEIENLMLATLTYYLERRLKSASFLARLRRESRQSPSNTTDQEEEDPPG
jgi:DNA repair protein RecO (recombination protein O)